MITKVGLDFGNRRVKICLQAIDENGNIIFKPNGQPKLLFASIPSLYSFDEPVIIKNGQEKKTNAFSLLFRVDGKDIKLWFDDDVLASDSIIQKIDAGKYNKSHIQRLTQAVLYKWGKQHKPELLRLGKLGKLGKLDICVSMPPGLYQKQAERKQAIQAYKSAFSTGQSHIQLRDGKQVSQIVTKFHSLVREAVVWGSDIPRRNELILVADWGGGTDEIALFNGGTEPVDFKTFNTGLLHTYQKIDHVNPEVIELRVMKDKSYFPRELLTYFNRKELMLRTVNRSLPKPVDRIYIIGGGAEVLPKELKSAFTQLADKVVIKGQYAGAEANWKEASK